MCRRRGHRRAHPAANALGVAFHAHQYADPVQPVNGARFVFLNPAAQEFLADWETIATDVVGILRAAAARDPYDKRLTDLVGELSTRSEESWVRWATDPVNVHRIGTTRFHHPWSAISRSISRGWSSPADPGQRLTFYSAEPGSSSRERLDLLASWATTPSDTGKT